MSTLDENGILVYDESDERDDFSALLNMGMGSVSDAVGADRARLAVLEDSNELGDISGTALTAASGWSIISQSARKKNGVAWARVRVQRTGAAISGGASGNIPNALCATFSTGWAPAPGMWYPAAAADTGPLVTGYVAEAGIYIGAISPGTTIATGDELSLITTYPLA
ncbi:hypothetical protein [Microbacterium soli]|uniref:Uncharacterized protein n=1 Tax=Microbacterium soli TaxID=446075 RepID=A0ABP7NK38_9MICO